MRVRKQLEKQNTDCKKKKKKKKDSLQRLWNSSKFFEISFSDMRCREREKERKALKHPKMSIFRACSKKRKVKFSYYRDKLDFWTMLVADLTAYDTFLDIFPLFEHLEHGPTNAMNKNFYLCGKWNVYFNFYTQIIWNYILHLRFYDF